MTGARGRRAPAERQQRPARPGRRLVRHRDHRHHPPRPRPQRPPTASTATCPPRRSANRCCSTWPQCVFPYCTRRTRRCDLDHRCPHGDGGPSCPCNLTPLCRTHHRMKTFSGWTYEPAGPPRPGSRPPSPGPAPKATGSTSTTAAPPRCPTSDHPAPHPAGSAGRSACGARCQPRRGVASDWASQS